MKYFKRLILIFSLLAFYVIGISQPTWTVTPTEYQNSMSVTGVLNVEGEISEDVNDRIGVFFGDECRGAGKVALYEDKYYVIFSIYSDASQEDLTIKIYDASESKTYDLKQRIAFAKDEILGSFEDPFVFYTNLNEKKLNAYNVFTPNKDGKNDFFIIDDLLAVKDLTMKIFTANGVEVYKQRDYDNTWEGVDKNEKDLPKGNYYYVFVDDDKKVIYKGSITLIR